jgi:hypothetical protein
MTRVCLTLAFVGACGSGLTADQACAQSSQAACSQLMTCSAAGFQKRWPDLATCETREKLACTDALAAKGTANTPSHTATCATALAMGTCGAFLSGVMPPQQCLSPAGASSDGSPCSFNAQCKSAFCAIAKTSLCGTCQEPPAVGQSCANNGCGPTMLCTGTMACQIPVGVGGACAKASLPCAVELACVGETATAMGSCVTQVATLGAACDHTLRVAANCDTAQGLTCDNTTDQCVMQPIVPAPQQCGFINGVLNACASGAACFGTTTQTCVAPAADGTACDTAAGPDCEFPSKCIPPAAGGTAGTCELPGSMSC